MDTELSTISRVSKEVKIKISSSATAYLNYSLFSEVASNLLTFRSHLE